MTTFLNFSVVFRTAASLLVGTLLSISANLSDANATDHQTPHPDYVDSNVLVIDNPFELYSIRTPFYQANLSDFQPRLGTYTYRVSWQGIGAAEIEVEVMQEGMEFVVNARAKTNSFVDVFYKLRYDSIGTFSAIDLRPQHTIFTQKENSREKVTEILFENDGTIRSSYWRKDKFHRNYLLRADNFITDPFSAGFLARSLDWWEGRTAEFDTFVGKTRYLISLTAKEKTTMKLNGKETPVWKIVPTVRKSNEAHAHKKLKKATIYVTADEHREIVKLSSSVFVGSVNTTLKSFVPSKKAPARQQFANWKKLKISRVN